MFIIISSILKRNTAYYAATRKTSITDNFLGLGFPGVRIYVSDNSY